MYLCTRKTKKHRGVEQLVARQAHNLEVARSNPASATKERGTVVNDGASLAVSWFFLELFQYADSFFRARMCGKHRVDEIHQPLFQLLWMDDVHLCNVLTIVLA